MKKPKLTKIPAGEVEKMWASGEAWMRFTDTRLLIDTADELVLHSSRALCVLSDVAQEADEGWQEATIQKLRASLRDTRRVLRRVRYLEKGVYHELQSSLFRKDCRMEHGAE